MSATTEGSCPTCKQPTRWGVLFEVPRVKQQEAFAAGLNAAAPVVKAVAEAIRPVTPKDIEVACTAIRAEFERARTMTTDGQVPYARLARVVLESFTGQDTRG